MLGNYDLIIDSLEESLEQSYSWEWAKEPPSLDNHIFTVFHGDGHDVYYVLCDKQEKKNLLFGLHGLHTDASHQYMLPI